MRCFLASTNVHESSENLPNRGQLPRVLNRAADELLTKPTEVDVNESTSTAGRVKHRLTKAREHQKVAQQITEPVAETKPKTEGHAELYKYITAYNDKLVAARESMINRLGNVRLIAGLLLSVLALSLPVVTKDIEASHTLISRLLMLFPLLTLSAAVYLVVRALMSVPELIGQVDVALPGMPTEQLKDVLAREELDLRKMLRQLSQNYFSAVEENKKNLTNAGRALLKAARYLRLALFCTVAFFGSTLAVYVYDGWAPAKPAATSVQTPMTKGKVHARPRPPGSTKPSPPTSGTSAPNPGP